MDKPVTKNISPESCDKLWSYAMHLENQLTVNKHELKGDDLKKAVMDLKYAWRDYHGMCIHMSQSYATRALQALNAILTIT